MSLSPLRKELENGLKEMCLNMGFKRQAAHQAYYKPVNNEFYGTLDFTWASFQQKGHMFVMCLVGVIYRPLDEMFKKYAELPNPNRFMEPSMRLNIGYFAPENDALAYEWDFHDQVDRTKFFDDIKTAIVNYAYPAFERYSNPDELLSAFLDCRKGGTLTSLPASKAIMYYLRGNKTSALKCLDYYKECKYPNAYEEKFDKNFRKLLEADL